MTVTIPAPRPTPHDPATPRQITVRRLLVEHLVGIGPSAEFMRVIPALLAALDPHLAPELDPALQLDQGLVDVLHGLAEGKTSAVIGRDLRISEHAVKSRAHRLYAIMGARDRAHAVAKAYQAGILR